MRASKWALATAVVAVVALGLLAVPASADHGYQTFKFTNKTDKRVYEIQIVFDRELSHIGDEDPTWAGATCSVLHNRRIVECVGGRRIVPGNSFKLSVATPPNDDGSYARAKIDRWYWLGKDGNLVKKYTGCARRGGCIDLGVQK